MHHMLDIGGMLGYLHLRTIFLKNVLTNYARVFTAQKQMLIKYMLDSFSQNSRFFFVYN